MHKLFFGVAFKGCYIPWEWQYMPLTPPTMKAGAEVQVKRSARTLSQSKKTKKGLGATLMVDS